MDVGIWRQVRERYEKEKNFVENPFYTCTGCCPDPGDYAIFHAGIQWHKDEDGG